MKSEERKKRILPITLVAAVVPLLLFLTIPFETYCVNFEELDFPFVEILPLHVLAFVFAFVVVWIVLFVLPQKIYNLLYGLILGVGFMLYLQNNVLNRFGDSSLALDSFKGISDSVVLINGSIWIVVLVAFCLLYFLLNNKGIIRTIGLALSAFLITVQLTSITSELISNPKALASWNDRNTEQQYVVTTNGLNTFSSKHNVFVFCLDKLDEKFCEEAFERNNSVFSSLSDFTWHTDSTSRYGHTFPSIVYMMTEMEHDLSEDRETYFNRAYTDSKVLRLLKENGYQIRFFSEPYYTYTTGKYFQGLIENVSKVKDKKIDSKRGLAYDMVMISFYKTSPFYFRTQEYFRKLSTAALMDYIEVITDGTMYSSELEKLSEALDKEELQITDQNVYTFIHTEGLHNLTDEEWKGEDSASLNKKDEVLLKNLQFVDSYIQKLKELGIYDNATIIVTGDHGVVWSDEEPLSETNLTALFIKPSQSRGMFEMNRGLSHSDLYDIIFHSEGIETETEWTPRLIREFSWDAKDKKRYEYEIGINARDFSDWKLSETITSSLEYSTFEYKAA